MITAISNASPQAAAQPAAAQAVPGSPFNAALAAELKAKQRQAAHDEAMKQIREKGFTTYVRDQMAEKLRDELRKKLLAAKGLSEDDLTRLPPSVRAMIEKQIEDAIRQQMEQAVAEQGKEAGKDGGKDKRGQDDAAAEAGAATRQQAAATRQELPDRQAKGGKTCPVIPILAWPGGPSLLG